MMKTQKELKELYKEELKKVWDDLEMVDYCSKKAAYIIEHNGKLYEIEKPNIKKDFCFGYGFNGGSTEEEENNAFNMEELARTKTDYFIEENLKDIDWWLKKLNEILKNMRLNWVEGSHPIWMIGTKEHYYNQPSDCLLSAYTVVDTFRDGFDGELCTDTELLEKLIAGYETVKTEFIKRLNSYLKRYGLSKLNTWTYLRD